MAKQRFTAPVIDLPTLPDGPLTGEMMGNYTRALVLMLTHQASLSIIRPHSIIFTAPRRSGVQLFPWETYIDAAYTVKVVSPDEFWMGGTELRTSYGVITVS